jgi:hypothetical protein
MLLMTSVKGYNLWQTLLKRDFIVVGGFLVLCETLKLLLRSLLEIEQPLLLLPFHQLPLLEHFLLLPMPKNAGIDLILHLKHSALQIVVLSLAMVQFHVKRVQHTAQMPAEVRELIDVFAKVAAAVRGGRTKPATDIGGL